MNRFRIGAIELSVEIRGAGAPLLLVHGFPLDHTMWTDQLEQLSANYRVIAPDLRGFGQSDVTGGTVTMAQFAADLSELLKVLQILEPVCFCGLSMGGYIAWQFWQHHRDQLGALVLCDTRAAADTPDAARGRGVAAAEAEKHGPRGLAETMAGKLFADQTRRERPELVERIKQVMIDAPPAGVAAALRGMAARPDMTSKLHQIDVPSLVICGQRDIISPATEMRGIAERMPQARYLEIAQAGHMAPLEQPEVASAAIAEFLAGL